MMFRFLRHRRGSRLSWWPIRVGLSPMRWTNVSHHGWEIGAEPDPKGRTAFGYMQGLRGVYGHAVTIGPIQFRFGTTEYLGLFNSIPEES